ncbi:hypothetical protein WR30_33170 [Burkholderia contaminans FFH2055]|nr:hypothetical protein WR30_33170 [Burkholderia contaminans FFH2055]
MRLARALHAVQERGDAGGTRHPAAARDALPGRSDVRHVQRQRAVLRQFGECAAPAWCGWRRMASVSVQGHERF